MTIHSGDISSQRHFPSQVIGLMLKESIQLNRVFFFKPKYSSVSFYETVKRLLRNVCNETSKS